MNKTKKTAIPALLAALVLMASIFCACSAKAPPAVETSDWKLTIEGVEGVSTFTATDALKLTFTELDTAVTNKNGEETKSKYGGVLLKDLLNAIGVTKLTSITIEASDGYTAEYSAEQAFAEDVIVGWQRDKAVMENNEVYILPAQASGKTLVKGAVKLTIVR